MAGDKYVNNSLIRITFDNSLFEKKVEKSRKTINQFKNEFTMDKESEKSKKFFDGFSKQTDSFSKSTDKIDASSKKMFDTLTKGFKGLEDKLGAFNVDTLGQKIDNIADQITDGFHGIQAVVDETIRDLVDSAVAKIQSLWDALAIRPITTGFEEYETQIGAIQTILANTESAGTTLEDVTAALDELNLYADKTIYNFTEMTRNIGTFTAAGVDLDTSVTAIKGIANLAAISGSTSEQASNAMYQLSQALAAGRVSLQDWNSVVNAGMGGKVFQDALVETAKKMGVVVDLSNGFRESISGKETWMSSEILLETLKQFADENTELGKTGTEAATKVKTITQLWDTVQESVQSGWTTTWEYIIGDFGQSKELLSALSDEINALLQPAADARNAVLDFWATAEVASGTSPTEKIKDEMDNLDEIAQNVIRGFYGNGQERVDLLTQMGLDPHEVQQRVNEILGVVNSSSKKIEKKVDAMTGRDMLLGGLKNIAKYVLDVKNIAEDIWANLFDPITGENLTDLSRKFYNFTQNLKVNEDKASKWKKIFTGLFDILKLGKTIIGYVIDGFKNLVSSIDTSSFSKAFETIGEWMGIEVNTNEGLLGFVASIGTAVDDLYKKLESSGTLESYFTREIDPKKLEDIMNIFDGIFAIVRIAKRALDLVITGAKNLVSAFDAQPIYDALETIGSWIHIDFSESDGILGFLSQLSTGIQNLATTFENSTTLDEWFSKEISPETVEKWTTIFNGLFAIIRIGKRFIDLLGESFKKMAETIDFSPITDRLRDLKEPISDFLGFEFNPDEGLLGFFANLAQAIIDVADFFEQDKDAEDWFVNMGETVGLCLNYLIELIGEWIDFISLPTDEKIDVIVNAFKDLWEMIKEGWGYLKELAPYVKKFLKDPINNFLDFLENNAPDKIANFVKEIRKHFETLENVVDFILDIKAKIDELLGPLSTAVKPYTDLLLKEVNKNIPSAIDGIKKFKKLVEKGFSAESLEKNWFPYLGEGFDKAKEKGKEAANSLKESIGSTIDSVKDTFTENKTLDKNVDSINKFAESAEKALDEAGKKTEEAAEDAANAQLSGVSAFSNALNGLTGYEAKPMSNLKIVSNNIANAYDASGKRISGEIVKMGDTIDQSTGWTIEDLREAWEIWHPDEPYPGDEYFQKMLEGSEAVSDSTSQAVDNAEQVKDDTVSFYDIVKENAEKVNDIIKILAGCINTFLSTIDLSLFTSILGNVNTVIKKFGKGIKAFSDGVETILSPLDGVTGVLESMQSRIQASVIKTIALSILTLVISLLVLTKLDSKKTADASKALVLIFSGLITSFRSLGRLKDLKAADLAKTIGAITAGVGLIVAAFEKMAAFDANTFTKGMMGLAAIAGFFAVIMKTMSGMSTSLVGDISADVWNAIAMTLLSIAAAATILIIPVTTLGAFDFNALKQGLGSMIVLLLSLGLTVAMIADSIQKLGKAADNITGIAHALVALAIALNMLVGPVILISLFPLSIFGIVGVGLLLMAFAESFAKIEKSLRRLKPEALKQIAAPMFALAAGIAILMPAVMSFVLVGLLGKKIIPGAILFAATIAVITTALIILAKALEFKILDFKSVMSLGIIMTAIVSAIGLLLASLVPFLEYDVTKILITTAGVSLIIISLGALMGILGGIKKIDGSVIAALTVTMLSLIIMMVVLGGIDTGKLEPLLKGMAILLSIIGVIGVITVAIIKISSATKKADLTKVVKKVVPDKKDTNDWQKRVLAVAAVMASLAAAIGSVAAVMKLAQDAERPSVDAISSLMSDILTAVKENAKPLAEAIVALISAVFYAIKSYHWASSLGELYALFAYLAKVLMVLISSGDLINQVVTFILQLVVNILYILGGFVEAIVEMLVVLVIDIVNGLAVAILKHSDEIAEAIHNMAEAITFLFNTIFGTEFNTTGVMLTLAVVGILINVFKNAKIGIIAGLAILGIILLTEFTNWCNEMLPDDTATALIMAGAITIAGVIASMFKVAAVLGISGAAEALLPVLLLGLVILVGGCIYVIESYAAEFGDATAGLIADICGTILLACLAFLAFGPIGAIIALAIGGLITLIKYTLTEGGIDTWEEAKQLLLDIGGQAVKVIGFILLGIVSAFLAFSLIGGPLGVVIAAIVGVIALIIPLLTGVFDIHSPSKKMKEIGENIVQGLIDGINWLMDNLGELGKAIFEALWEHFEDGHLIEDAIEKGKNLIQGLIDGIKECGENIWDAMKEAVGSAFEKFCDFFGIESPSKLMAEMGRYIDQGLANGIIDETDTVDDAMTKLCKQPDLDPDEAYAASSAYAAGLTMGLYDEQTSVKKAREALEETAYNFNSYDPSLEPNIFEQMSGISFDAMADTKFKDFDLDSILNYSVKAEDTDVPDLTKKADEQKEAWDSIFNDYMLTPSLQDNIDDMDANFESLADFDLFGSMDSDKVYDSFDFDTLREKLDAQTKDYSASLDERMSEYGEGSAETFWNSVSEYGSANNGETSIDSLFSGLGLDSISAVTGDAGEKGGESFLDKLGGIISGDTSFSDTMESLGGTGFDSLLSGFKKKADSADEDDEDGGFFESILASLDPDAEVDMSVNPVLTAKSKGSLQEEVDESVKAGTVDVSADTRVGIEESGMASTIDKMHQNDVNFYRKMEQFKTDMGTLVGQNNSTANRIRTHLEGILGVVKDVRDDVDSMQGQIDFIKSDVMNIKNSMGHDIYIEPGALVGAIGDEMDAYLGTKSVRQSRTNGGRVYGPQPFRR